MKKSLQEMLAEKNSAGGGITNPPPVNEIPKPKGFLSVTDNQIKLDPAYLRQCNLFIATPCYGGNLTDQYFLSMFRLSQLLMQAGINFRITTLRNESLIPRARNILTAMFLEDKSCTHLFFVDADIEFEPESVLRMLAFDKDLIAGAYPKKTINWDGVKRAVKAGVEDISASGADYAINLKFRNLEKRQVRFEYGAIEVLDASTGFFMVKRNVFDRMIKQYPELHYNNDSNLDPKFNPYCYALFDTLIDPVDRRYLSEDYTFCRRFQQMGGEIWIDINTKLNHVGSFTYPGNVSTLFTVKPPTT